ncbi:DUF2917 domain-containing protein [Ideonella sp. BN130291]|uniref:DUF2917 domain-containing protein n=1 Tax=Ideonella sp. BN130291 TaxID=3112940 RepID=UPI002E253F3B|nr:DUF2917 domain-containing protein [Ideonella sp. BN130291]
MSTTLMSHSQESSASQAVRKWGLTEGSAMRLAAEDRGRWLLVTEGRVWLTTSATTPEQVPHDCWLEAGDSIELPASQDAVIESWPSARFELRQVAPGAEVSASLALKPSAALRRWLQALRPSQQGPAPAPCAS